MQKLTFSITPSHRTLAWRQCLDTIALITLLSLSWQILSWILGTHVLPTLGTTLTSLLQLFQEPDFYLHIKETAQAFIYALLIAISGGVITGLILGMNRLVGDVFEPLLMAAYSVPKIVLYPVMLLLFGLGMSSKVAFGVIHGIIPIIIFTMTALRQIRPVYIRVAMALRMSWPRMAWKILIPAARPEIFTGLRIGFSLTLLGTLIGEMFASRFGLGQLLMHAIERNQPNIIMAISLLLFVFAICANMFLLALDKKLRHG